MCACVDISHYFKPTVQGRLFPLLVPDIECWELLMGLEPNTPVTQKYSGSMCACSCLCVKSDNMKSVMINGLNGAAVHLAMSDGTCGPDSFA